MTRTIAALLASLFLSSTPAQADYAEARDVFQELPTRERAAATLGLIATGDFDGLADHGFTPRFYRAMRNFEAREGFTVNGVPDPDELERLGKAADDFNRTLGPRHYVHPHTSASLLVPRALFDVEKETAEGLLFIRNDGMMSLAFLSFPANERSYESLWGTLSAPGADKRVIYQRRFANRFFVTGIFRTSKFYTMMARTGRSTTGFTFSWGAPFDELGRKVSTFLANAWLAEIR